MRSTDVEDLLSNFVPYRTARLQLLASLGKPQSYRDPMAEFSEQLVATLLGGTLAASVVQKGWDLTLPSGERVQVRYLANSSQAWVNWHVVAMNEHLDAYALVVFIDLLPESVLVFRGDLSELCRLLGKRHPNQGVTLQITRRNYLSLLEGKDIPEGIGVEVFDLRPLAATISSWCSKFSDR